MPDLQTILLMFVAIAACFLLPVISPARWIRKMLFKTPVMKEYDSLFKSNLWNMIDIASWLLLMLAILWFYSKIS